MRLIADKPEFTWGGTIFIVLGFTIFGLAQSIAAIAHRRATRSWRLTIARMVGAIGLMPLFVAAGGVMFPTVVGGGLASARRQWRPVTRWIWLVPAAVSVAFVGHDLVGKFGWSIHTVAGFTAMLALYATIVWAARFTFTTRPDGWRFPRWARVALIVVLGLVVVFFTAGAIFK
jgi:hypothetical protein